MSDDFSDVSSKYNEAVFQIQRLHESWIRCYNFQRNGELDKWKFELDNIWLELISDVEERLGNSNDIKEKNKQLRLNIANSKTREQKYEALMERHSYLKVIQDKTGKGGSYSDGSEDDFE